MPTTARRPCKQQGCRALVSSGAYCSEHASQRRKIADATRGSSTARGYGYKWQQASKGFLRQHPLCQCEGCQEGKLRVLEATVVDHKIPHRGDMQLFWDRDNWQAMAKPCHDKKTAKEDGGFRGANQGGGQKSGGFFF